MSDTESIYRARLLIVEDFKVMQHLLCYILKRGNFKNLTTATTFRQAKSIIKKNPIDLILLDWMLYDDSELSLLTFMQENNHNIPVIMVTGEKAVKDVVRARNLGAVDYVIKPIEGKVLLEKVRLQLELHGKFAPDSASQSVS